MTTVQICLGPGGVGKTTVAAAAALEAAQRGQRAVVLTIDPAKRLANALGFASNGLNHNLTEVEGDWSGQLWATMLDPKLTLEQIVKDQASSAEQCDRIFNNKIFKSLTTSLSGTNEYMATERLHQLWQSGDFDVVVVDTPPSKHAFDFLDSPQRLSRFLNHHLYRTLFAPKPGLLRSFNLAAQQVLRAMSRFVGSELTDDVISFFSDFAGFERGFSRRASAIDDLLRSNQTSYVVVTSPTSEAVTETEWIMESLTKRNIHTTIVIANRTTPVVLNNDAHRWASQPATL